jgi:hypothetical protein
MNPSDAPACEHCGLILNEENVRRTEPRPAPEFAPHAGGFVPGIEGNYAPREGHDAGAHDLPDAADAESLPVDFYVRPFEFIGDVLTPTLKIYRDNFPLIAKIILTSAVPLVLLQSIFTLAGLDEGWEWLAQSLMNVAGGSLLAGALIYALVKFLRSGVNPSVAESYGWGLKKWLTLLGCTICFNFITSIGYLLLIIPGVILSLKYALVIPVAAMEDTGVTDAFTRSDDLTKGYRWQIFGTQFVLGALVLLISIVTTYSYGSIDGMAKSFLWLMIYGITMQILQSATIVLSFFIYLGILANARPQPFIASGTPPPPDAADIAPHPRDYEGRPLL